MKKKRKLFCQYGPVCYKISLAKEAFKKDMKDFFKGRRFARKIDKNNYSLGKKEINNSTNKLPQTGENNNSQKLSIIGMMLMGILGLFGLDRKKKKN